VSLLRRGSARSDFNHMWEPHSWPARRILTRVIPGAYSARSRIRALPCPRKGLRPPDIDFHLSSLRWTLFCPRMRTPGATA